MSHPLPPPEQSQPTHPLNVERLQRFVWEQEKTIQSQQQTIKTLEQPLKRLQARIEQLEEELRAQKKLKGKAKLSASQLPKTAEGPQPGEGKRAGSAKQSKKKGFAVDEEQIIHPTSIPDQARFNGYRTYDVPTIERSPPQWHTPEYPSHQTLSLKQRATA